MSDFFEKLKKEEPYTEYTLDMFSKSAGKEASEVGQFNNWRNMVSDADKYTFEVPHLGAQKPEISIKRENGDQYDLISFSSYNYLGYSYHPDVIQAGKDALDKYGLGATGSPLLNGTFEVHKELEGFDAKYLGNNEYVLYFKLSSPVVTPAVDEEDEESSKKPSEGASSKQTESGRD